MVAAVDVDKCACVGHAYSFFFSFRRPPRSTPGRSSAASDVYKGQGGSVASYTFDSAHFESKFGSEQLLTPEQLARKTRALTGVAWRTNKSPDGTVHSKYDELSVLLGGIDSEAVTARAIELTPTMTSILMTHATESACIAVARQFSRPQGERSLFTLVDEGTLPLSAASSSNTLPSEKQGAASYTHLTLPTIDTV